MTFANLNNDSFISVVIITYNSEEFILETLDSVQRQEFDQIELIISDDASTDQTVKICEAWLNEHGSRFKRSLILKNRINIGVSGNCNRGVKAAEGEWIKILAGDDILLKTCLIDNVNFISKYKNEIIVSKVIHFINDETGRKIVKTSEPFWGKNNYPKNALEQYEALLLSYCGNTTSLFLSKKLLLKIPFDESFPFIEDYPFLLNVTKQGIHIGYLDKETVMYRIRHDSVYHGSNQQLFSDFYLKSHEFDKKYRYPYLSKKRRKSEEYHFNRFQLLNKLKLNKKTPLNRFIFEISRYFNFYKYLMYLNDRKNL